MTVFRRNSIICILLYQTENKTAIMLSMPVTVELNMVCNTTNKTEYGTYVSLNKVQGSSVTKLCYNRVIVCCSKMISEK